jgi:hypothetical protein
VGGGHFLFSSVAQRCYLLRSSFLFIRCTLSFVVRWCGGFGWQNPKSMVVRRKSITCPSSYLLWASVYARRDRFARAMVIVTPAGYGSSPHGVLPPIGPYVFPSARCMRADSYRDTGIMIFVKFIAQLVSSRSCGPPSCGRRLSPFFPAARNCPVPNRDCQQCSIPQSNVNHVQDVGDVDGKMIIYLGSQRESSIHQPEPRIHAQRDAQCAPKKYVNTLVETP